MPPPTAFPAPAAVQVKSAAGRIAPPPVKFAAPIGLQAKAAPPAVRLPQIAKVPLALRPGGAIQKSESDSIGSRVRRRSVGSSFKSPRLREQYEATAYEEQPVYKEPKVRGRWDYKTRPAWYETTWDALSDDASQDPAPYTCVDCSVSPIYRKKDAPQQDRKTDATIDHKRQWMKYVSENGAPDGDGHVTSIGAKDAYNDVSNLQIMCRSCNARKNGEHNVFD